MLKTCIMEEYAELDGPVEDTMEYRIYFALCIYHRLEAAFRQGRLNMFLIPGQNLLSSLDDEKIELARKCCILLQEHIFRMSHIR